MSVQPESLGLPDHDTAFHQALACRYRHQVVKAAAEATGVFDLRTGEVNDDRLRKRFGFHYAEMVRRWANNIPLSQPVIHAIEHDTGKSLLALAEDEAEQQPAGGCKPRAWMGSVAHRRGNCCWQICAGKRRRCAVMHDLRPVMFTVPGEPVGKGRPRIGRVGAHARMFTPAKTANYEGLIAHSGQQAMAGRALFEGPVLVELDIALSIPQSMSKKRKSLALAGGLYPTKKPDMDNVIKAIYDGLNGVVWKDDVQVVKAVVGKRYGETPGVRVKIVPLLEGEQ